MMTDQPTQIRPGEELDTARLQAYLLEHLPGARGSLEVLQFPSGFSNLTYLLRLGELELVLRRPPFGANIRTAHDMGREYRILSALKPVYPKVPQPLLYCADENVLGAPFYVMERLHGVILRTQPPPGLTPERMRGVCQAALEALVELHSLDYQKAGLGDLGRPEGYVERQVRGWAERYQKARTDTIPGMERTMEWLTAHALRIGYSPHPQRLQIRQPAARPRRPHPGDGRAGLGDGHPGRPPDGSGHYPGLLGAGGRSAGP